MSQPKQGEDTAADDDRACACACGQSDVHGREETGARRSHHAPELKKSMVSRLNRIEGQIRGIKGLIEKDTYCDDVLNQIAAAQSALNAVGRLLLEEHMKSCVIERIQAGEDEVIEELLITVKKLMK